MRAASRFQWISSTTRECQILPLVALQTTNNTRNGLNMRPQPFKVNITPRNDTVRQTMIREGEQALADLAQFDGETKYRMSTFYKQSQ